MSLGGIGFWPGVSDENVGPEPPSVAAARTRIGAGRRSSGSSRTEHGCLRDSDSGVWPVPRYYRLASRCVLLSSLAMSEALPVVHLARHGQTAWTISGQHTGLTDLPLTSHGEAEAIQLAERLAGLTFAAVLTSPLQRAVRTCNLAGFGAVAQVEPDLVEWNYGAFEGRTSTEIRAEHPGWVVFRDGCPGGESPEQIGSRADRVIRRVRAIGGDVLLFSSAHFLRVFAARWLGLE